MKLYPLDLGSIYVLDMPPARAELTLSITFDAAVFLDLGVGAWPPCTTREETVAASRWVFHRQSGPRGAIVNVDDAEGRRTYEELAARADQVVIPISGRSRAPNGVYVAGGILYDDLGGRDEAITDLPVSGEAHAATTPLLAAAVYAAAVMVDIPKHAAMASLRGFFAV
jgi:UDP-N-acetylmuramoylalanine--D-glutamate ligase